MATTRSTKIERYRGDSHTEEFTLTDATGTVVDLTSASALFTVKRAETDAQADAILALSSVGEDAAITLGGVDGTVTVTFDADDMAAIDPGPYVYDVEVTLSDGTVHTVAKDRFDLLADVST